MYPSTCLCHLCWFTERSDFSSQRDYNTSQFSSFHSISVVFSAIWGVRVWQGSCSKHTSQSQGFGKLRLRWRHCTGEREEEIKARALLRILSYLLSFTARKFQHRQIMFFLESQTSSFQDRSSCAGCWLYAGVFDKEGCQRWYDPPEKERLCRQDLIQSFRIRKEVILNSWRDGVSWKCYFATLLQSISASKHVPGWESTITCLLYVSLEASCPSNNLVFISATVSELTGDRVAIVAWVIVAGGHTAWAGSAHQGQEREE